MFEQESFLFCPDVFGTKLILPHGIHVRTFPWLSDGREADSADGNENESDDGQSSDGEESDSPEFMAVEL